MSCPRNEAERAALRRQRLSKELLRYVRTVLPTRPPTVLVGVDEYRTDQRSYLRLGELVDKIENPPKVTVADE